MLKAFISKKAMKFLISLQLKQQLQLKKKILALEENPNQNDRKSLGDDYYRVTVGEYRIIFRFDPENLYIDFVGKRNDDEVYKEFDRR